jgi:hypothetical protein
MPFVTNQEFYDSGSQQKEKRSYTLLTNPGVGLGWEKTILRNLGVSRDIRQSGKKRTMR